MGSQAESHDSRPEQSFLWRFFQGELKTQVIRKLRKPWGLVKFHRDLTRPGPPKIGSWAREIPLFQINLGCWNIIIWPDGVQYWWVQFWGALEVFCWVWTFALQYKDVLCLWYIHLHLPWKCKSSIYVGKYTMCFFLDVIWVWKWYDVGVIHFFGQWAFHPIQGVIIDCFWDLLLPWVNVVRLDCFKTWRQKIPTRWKDLSR